MGDKLETFLLTSTHAYRLSMGLLLKHIPAILGVHVQCEKWGRAVSGSKVPDCHQIHPLPPLVPP